MFAVLKRNAMESPSVARLSPANLSPPPGLLPTLPVASTPNNMSTASLLVKQESKEQLGCFDDQRSSDSPFKPLPTIANIKVENTDLTSDKNMSNQDGGADSQMLKEKLEMYWRGILKYQQQQNGGSMATSMPDIKQESNQVQEYEMRQDVVKSPDVLEKAKNVVQRLIEDDHKSVSKMPWPSLATIAANRQIRSPKNGQNKHISNLSPPQKRNEPNLQQASILSQQAIATMMSLHRMKQQQQQMQDPNSLDLGGLLPPPPQPSFLRREAVQSLQSALACNGSNASHTTTSSNNHFTQTNTVPTEPRNTTTSTQSSSGTSPLDLSHDGNTAIHMSQSPTSEVSASTLDKCGSEDRDAPLDLSLSVSDRKRISSNAPKCVPKPPPPSNNTTSRFPPPLICVNQMKNTKQDTHLSDSAKATLPNLIDNQSFGKSPQQATLEAHIKNGLMNNLPPATGPFTSLYQSQEMAAQMLQMALAAAGGKTLNELVQSGVPPIQIQQWLLAAMSAQKAQQMALSQLSLMQQQQHIRTEEGPPKKRQKRNAVDVSHLPHLPLAQISSQSGILQQQNSNLLSRSLPNPQGFLTSESGSNLHRNSQITPPSNRKPKSNASPTLSPNSDQSQSGKRYRRYAKPPYSYVSLITLAILSSREKKLRLSQILKRISEMFPFFNGSYQGWRDSVRHNLSQNECFVKVLKNPYRPTAKGNFWTVNLNSIPHELLLRQNTLVSRYAQDSGYRYRKDLSEVFDLRSGVLKVAIPRQLLRQSSNDIHVPVLEDPAAVMEAILLEETSDDEMGDYKDKIPPEVQRFTLEDLFCQSEDAEDDSMVSSRGRGRSKQSHHISHSQPPTLIPRSFASSMFHSKPSFLNAQNSPTMVNNFQASLHSRALESQNLGLGILPPLIPAKTSQSETVPMSLPTTGPNPFAAAQTALLSKALASQLQGLNNFPVFQKMLYANQLAQTQAHNTTEEPDFGKALQVTKTPPPLQVVDKLERNSPMNDPALSPVMADSLMEENRQSEIQPDVPSSMKRNKRKGIQPVRHSTREDEMATLQIDETTDTSGLSPQHSSSFSAPSGPTSTPSRTLSSEADSAMTTSSNPFCSPVMSSSSKSHSSPRHEDSSEFDDSAHHPSQSLFSLENRENAALTGISGFQSLQMFGSQSLEASKMA